MSSLNCPRCGASNVPNARYCITCGNPLLAPPVMQPAIPYGAQPLQPYYPYYVPPLEAQRSSRIENTKIGLLLMMIGFFIGWLPFIAVIGGLLIIIGAIFVILGREAFGREHDRNVIISIILFVVGVGVFIVGFVVAFFAALTIAQSNPGSFPQTGWFDIPFIVGGATIGLAEVVFTYALQQSNGRAILWTAFALSIALGIVNTLITPSINGPGILFSGQLFLVSALLSLPASILFGLGYYLARERIVRGEIPPPITTQRQPATNGPSGPTLLFQGRTIPMSSR